MSTNSPPCVLSIAGTDPSGGAGIHADIKAISATGSYAAAVITALVAQNTQWVEAIVDITPEFLSQQLHAVFCDLDIKAIKIGMLHTQSIIETVANNLNNYKGFIVIDPVMVAKNGASLLQSDVVSSVKTLLFPLATLITPNIPEAEALLNITLHSIEDMKSAAQQLGDDTKTNILLKGGHFNSDYCTDILYLHNKNTFEVFQSERVETKNTHGTGCTLSSAIASYLAQEYELTESVHLAKNYLTSAIKAGSDYHMGKGFGPVDHFYFLREKNYGKRKNYIFSDEASR